MDEVPAALSEVLTLCESLHTSIDALRDLARVTVDVDAGSPRLKVKGAQGQNIGLTLNRFTAVAPVSPGSSASGGAEAKKQKEAQFVQQSQAAAKGVQQLMVQLKDARVNVADPNRVCDKALALGSKITTMVVGLIKTVKQATLNDESNTHQLLHQIPTEASKIHDAIAEMQRVVETWSWTSRAGSNTVRGREQPSSVVKELASQTIVQVKALSDAVLNHDVQEFTKRAKEVAVLLSKVIKHAQTKGWKDVGEGLLRDAQALISAGKVAVKNPEGQKDFYAVVSAAMNNIKEFLRLFRQEEEGGAGGGGGAPRRPVLPEVWSRDSGGPDQLAPLGDVPAAVRVLCAQMPAFKAVWDKATDAERRAVVAGLADLGGADDAPPPTPGTARHDSGAAVQAATAAAASSAAARASLAESAGGGEEAPTEADLADVERGFKATLRDMQRWYNMLRTPFRFWAPNFDKTDYEAIIDRSTTEGQLIAAMVEPIDSIAGKTFLLIVNVNLCVAESEDNTRRAELLQKPVKGVMEQLKALLGTLKEANLGKRDAEAVVVTASIAECSKWLLDAGEDQQQQHQFVGETDELTVAAVTNLFVAGVIAASLKGKLYHECNRLRVTCIHLCSMLASLRKHSTLLPSHLMQILSGLRLYCEQVKDLLDTVATQTAVLRRLEQEQRAQTAADGAGAAADKKSAAATDDVSDLLDLKSQQALEFLTRKADTKTDAPGSSGVSIWRDENDANVIWEDKAARKGVRAANLNKLVQELTSTINYDTSFVQTFVATYQSFTTPLELFNKLMERYDVPSGMDAKMRQQIRLRVAIVVKHWVEHQFADFDQTIITKLYELCKRLEVDGQVPMGQALHKLIKKKDEARLAKLKSFLSVPPTDLQIPSGYMSPTDLFMLYHPRDVAEQMTLVDFAWFSDIEPRELLNQCWSKPKLQYRARNVLGLITRVNILSYWIPSLILWPAKIKQRVQVFEKFVFVAAELLKLGNFSALMAILAALGQSSTSRLTHTKAALSAEAKKVMKELEELMSPQRSFHNYRTALRACKPPAVPYLGVYLQDLTFIEDGNPEQLGDGLVNFERLGLVYGVLKEVLLYQQQSYVMPVLEPINTLLVSLPFSTEKNLYELSLLREPRGETDVSKIK